MIGQKRGQGDSVSRGLPKDSFSSYRVVGQIFCTILNKNQLRLIVCSIISCMVIVVNAVSIDLSRPIYYTRLRKLD